MKKNLILIFVFAIFSMNLFAQVDTTLVPVSTTSTAPATVARINAAYTQFNSTLLRFQKQLNRPATFYGTKTFTGQVTMNDSLKLMLLDNGRTRWLGLTPTGGVFADSLSNASFALKMQLPLTMAEHLADQVNDEVRWFYMNNGKILYTYKLNSLTPMQQIQSLMAGIEINKRYIKDLEDKYNALLELYNNLNVFFKQNAELRDLLEGHLKTTTK